MGRFVQDTFTDTDGTDLSAHTGELGATWTQHPSLAGAEKITGNRIRGNSTTVHAEYYASGVPATPDYDVQADMVVVDTSILGACGIGGRMSTVDETHYLVNADVSSATVKLYKSAAGSYTELGSVAHTFTANDVNRLTLQMHGTTISGYIDSTLIATVTDTAISAAGRADARLGLALSVPDATHGLHLDNFLADYLGPFVVATPPMSPGMEVPIRKNKLLHQVWAGTALAGTTVSVDLLVTATGTPTLLKIPNKVLSVTATGTVTMLKQAAKVLAATATGTISLFKTVLRTLTVTATGTPTLTAVKVAIVTLSVTATATVTLLKRAGKVLAVTATGTPSVLKRPGKILSVTATGTPTMTEIKVAVVLLSVTATATVTLLKRPGKVLAVTATGTPAIVRMVSRALAVTSAVTVSLLKQPGRTLAVTATATAVFVRQVQKRLSVSVISIVQLITQAFTTAVTPGIARYAVAAVNQARSAVAEANVARHSIVTVNQAHYAVVRAVSA